MNAVMAMYESAQTDGGTFYMKVGLHQGSVLNPVVCLSVLFVLVTRRVVESSYSVEILSVARNWSLS